MSRRSVLVVVVSAAMVASGLVGVNTAAWASPQAVAADPAVVGVGAVDPVPPGADVGSWPKNSYASSSMVRLNAEQSAVAGAMYLAQRDNKEVPIPEFTSETIQVWARPDGTVHEETAAAPVRAKVNGAWQSVDATLVKGGDGVWRPKVSAVEMAFSGGGAGPVATLSRDGVSIAYTFPEALPTPSVDGPSLTYPNVYPGVDLVVTASSSTLSQVLVIKDKAAAKNPKVRVVRVKTAVKGGTLVGGKDGGYAVHNAKGEPVLTGAGLPGDSRTRLLDLSGGHAGLLVAV